MDRLSRMHAPARGARRLASAGLIIAAAVIAGACSGRDDGKAAEGSVAAGGSGPDGAAQAVATVAARDTLTVYKSPTCGCCRNWVEHMRANGFHVIAVDQPDVTPVKREHGVTEQLASCHTALVSGYAIEGHVPAADVRRLLAERPAGVRGLAVPGMPTGSPGMEMPGTPPDRYDVVAFDSTGRTRVFASH